MSNFIANYASFCHGQSKYLEVLNSFSSFIYQRLILLMLIVLLRYTRLLLISNGCFTAYALYLKTRVVGNLSLKGFRLQTHLLCKLILSILGAQFINEQQQGERFIHREIF